MLGELLPDGVAWAEERGLEPCRGELLAAEEPLAAGVSPRRRLQLSAGRDCARRALIALGLPAAPILRGDRGEPLWPKGAVGGITHCDGYAAAAAARAGGRRAVAIDAEPHAPLPPRLRRRLPTAREHRRLDALARADASIHWDKLLFSAKECAYKALAPAAGTPPSLAALELDIDADRRRFEVRAEGNRALGVSVLEGRWLVGEGLVLTAIAIAA